MSDHDLGKKLVEEIELQSFLDEYRGVTRRKLEILERSERPDFICSRADGHIVGVELVRVMEEPGLRQAREILSGSTEADALDASIRLQETVYSKESKRASNNWRYSKSTILVIQVMDVSIERVAYHLDDELMDEMSETGFIEIWAADYTLIKLYGTVQLLGIKPKRWRRLYPHAFYGQKPYG